MAICSKCGNVDEHPQWGGHLCVKCADPLGEQMAWIIDGNRYHGMTSVSTASPYNYAANALERFRGNRFAAVSWLNDDWGMEGAARNILRRAKTWQRAA